MSVVAAFAVPHPPLALAGVGRGQERRIASTLAGYREVGRRIAQIDPDVLVFSSPHATAYQDYIHISPGARAAGDFARFGDPDDELEADYDEELVRAVCAEAALAGVPAGCEGERDPALDHGTMVPLSFIREAGVRCPIVRMGISGLSALEHYRLGECIERACARLGRRAVYVASGDLSHKLLDDGPYGFAPEGPVFDRQVCEAFETADFGVLLGIDRDLCERAAECGLRSFQIMAGTMDGREVASELLSYEGPYGVGYGVAAFTPGAPDPARRFGERHAAVRRAAVEQARAAEDPWVRLARTSLETYVRTGKQLELTDELLASLPDELCATRAGAFCSIKKDGELRGCIGTIGPCRANLAEEIAENAVSAGTCDPRFDPVTPDELADLVYSVDVLGRPEPVRSTDELDPARYGVIVSTRDGRRGLLLPDLAGVDTAEEQVSIARRKGGIRPNEHVELERFEVVRHR